MTAMSSRVTRLPEIEAAARQHNIPLLKLGKTEGDRLTLPGERPILVAELRDLHESWLPAYMAARDP